MRKTDIFTKAPFVPALAIAGIFVGSFCVAIQANAQPKAGYKVIGRNWDSIFAPNYAPKTYRSVGKPIRCLKPIRLKC